MNRTRLLMVTALLGLLIGVGGLPSAAQDPAADEMTLVQVTQIANTTSQTFLDALLSGNGLQVVYGAPAGYSSDRTLYLNSSDGTGDPYPFDTSVDDPEIGGMTLLDVSYDGRTILYFKETPAEQCDEQYVEGYGQNSPCGFYIYDGATRARTRFNFCYIHPTHPQWRRECLWPLKESLVGGPPRYLITLSGDGQYLFFLADSYWYCTPRNDALYPWNCTYLGLVLWRVPVAELDNPAALELWGLVDEIIPEGASFYTAHALQSDYDGKMAALAMIIQHQGDDPSLELGLYFSRGRGWQHQPATNYWDTHHRLSADGKWIAYENTIDLEKIYHLQYISGSPRYTNTIPIEYPWLRDITQDGTQVLFESRLVGESPLWLADRFGVFSPVTAIAPGPLCKTSALSYDGQVIACPMDQHNVGDYQYFVVRGTANPDLSLDRFSLNPAAAAYSGGRYILPVDVTVRNTGLAPAADFQVRLSDNGGWGETRSIAGLASGGSTVLHLDWDITGLLSAGRGQARVELVVAADPADLVVETSNLDNIARAAVLVDARPRLAQVRPGYRPGTFLAGVAVQNNLDVWVDWNGALSGSGAPGESKRVTYELNGASTVKPVSNPAAAPAASHTYDMGSDLRAGTNVLRLQAENAAGFRSDSHTLTLHRADNAAWLAGLTVKVEAEPPGAAYDKIAVYKCAFEWPDERLEGYFDVPADKVNVLKKEYGPQIDAWSLGVEFRSDGAGAIEGSGEFEGEVKGIAAVKATVRAAGAVRAAERLRLTKLEGSLRGEGEMSTPRVPLSPWLPFLYTQAKIGAGADATLGVYEQANGALAWSPLVLGLDATVEGTLSSGWEKIAYVEGGVGGRPRGEFNLPPDPSLLRGLTVRLYAWGKGQFLLWEKGYEAEYEYVAAGPGGQEASVRTLGPRSTGWRLREAPAAAQPFDGTGPLAMDYAYADPVLAIAADDTMLLLWVDDVGSQLEIRASRWDGAAWSATAELTANALLDAYPDVAYAGAGRAVALWAQLPDDTPPADPHDALAAFEIMAAAWDGAAWSAPVRLTDDARMDGRPKLAADAAGRVLALWLQDADGSFPLYPDESSETLGGDLYYTLWDGAAWLSPTLAVSGVASDEAPQLARAGDAALAAWSQDADGSIGTLTDTAIYYAAWFSPTWGAAQPLAGVDDGVADAAPRVAYNAAGQAHLVWVKERVAQGADPDDAVDQLYFSTYSGGAWSTPTVVVEASAIQSPQLLVDSQGDLVALWLARSDAGVDVWYAVYDRGAALWSDPLLLTHDADAPTDYDAVLDSADTLRVVLTGREVVTATYELSTTLAAAPAAAQTIVYPALGQVRPAEHRHTLGRDLTLTSLVVTPTNPAPGTTGVLSAAVYNSGDLAVAGGAVAFYDGDPAGGGTPIGAVQVLPDPFRAGAAVTVSVPWNVPAGLVSHTVYALVDPAAAITESVESNNQVSLTTVLPDLEVAWARTTWCSDTVTVTAHVRNRGVSPVAGSFTVVLRADDPAGGAEVAGAAVPAGLLPGEGVTLALALADPAAVLTGTHVAWVVADAGEEVREADETNNTALSALDVAADLTLGPADIAGAGPVVVTVHNTGFITATAVGVVVRVGGITGTLLYSDTLNSLAAGGAAEVTLSLRPGAYVLYAHVDPDDAIAENDESDNLAVRAVTIPFRAYLPLVPRRY